MNAFPDSCVLDPTRLPDLKARGSKWIAGCPACIEAGSDSTKSHLAIFPNGAHHCIAAGKDHAARNRELAGRARDWKPSLEDSRRFRQVLVERRRSQADLTRRNLRAKAARPALVEQWAWSWEDWQADSPLPVTSLNAVLRPEFMIAALFPPDALVWTGEVRETGSQRHAARWRQAGEIAARPGARVGPMIAPAIWKPGTVSRKAENIAAAPYVVLDFDGFDGTKPQTPDELSECQRDALAIVRWLWQDREWQLAAVLWTGSKSIHAWFHDPGKENRESLWKTAEGLGIDPAFKRPNQPCRLSCQVHAKTGNRSRLLWLDHAALKITGPSS